MSAKRRDSKTEALEAQAKALEATVDERTQEIRAQAVEIAAQKDSIELLSEIGKEITASLDLNTILFKLYERVNQIVDAKYFRSWAFTEPEKQHDRIQPGHRKRQALCPVYAKHRRQEPVRRLVYRQSPADSDQRRCDRILEIHSLRTNIRAGDWKTAAQRSRRPR